jgi:hypothetical protein
MIDGRKGILTARLGKTPGDVFFRHVLDDGRDVFDYMAVTVDDFVLGACHIAFLIVPYNTIGRIRRIGSDHWK